MFSGPWYLSPRAGATLRPRSQGESGKSEPAAQHSALSLLQPLLDQFDPFRLLINP